ncbi:peptide transporter [Candidatus Pelagibacter communis]|uniref:Predicted O-linked N-acetylglucosamine transferase n=1 Tax=Pelagibacter ubique (strain HTCC1062) TaxID=335992 RepID=Q4FNR8_PELUB|nr:peptide transporter [Candidatus Pelagibacter ubique]AAZ21171.1 Predicted O-linked N-acetylglucosamine transferase [Candidatus Pelagibacter ubique HTCC1062]
MSIKPENINLNKIFIKYLNEKQYSKLQLHYEKLGKTEKQLPAIIFYYACAITLNPSSNIKNLKHAHNLFEMLYVNNRHDLQLLCNMIELSFRTQEFKVVLPYVEEAYKINQSDERLLLGLSKIHLYLANLKESIKYYKILFKINPKSKINRDEFLTSLNYASGITQEYYLSECKNYLKLLETNKDLEDYNFNFKNLKNNKIKIGFLSSDFKTHPVSFFLKGLLLNFNKDKFEISLISNLHKSHYDNITDELKLLTKNWININSLSDSEATNLLRSFELDILIDLCGFFRGNRFQVISNRAAKIQACWLGYNNTTGIKNMDYLIADHNLIKKEEEKLYSEKVLFLPKIWNAMTPSNILPEIQKNNSIFTYASFNNFHKISDDTIDVWSKILNNSNSQIILKNPMPSSIVGEELKLNLLKKFIARGVEKKKILFINRKKDFQDHLGLYNNVDVALDTFPYPGVTTTFDAVLMGVPVLTMKGHNLNSRCGESININLQMQNFIAENKDDYFNKALSLQKEKNILQNFGKNLREKVLKSSLFDTKDFTKSFEKIIQKIISK